MKLASYILGFSLLCSWHSIESFQVSPAQKALYQVRLSMAFGDPKADQEVYLFTDWNDKSTKEIEAKIETVAPEILKTAKLYFIDLNSDKSQEATQLNLTQLVDTKKNLSDYFKFRNALIKNELPKDATILPEDVSQSALRIFNATATNMKIAQAPTLLFYNLKTRESVKLEGTQAILDSNIASYLK